MHFLEWILDTLRDPRGLIEAGGYYALGLVIFLETGAMVFFLPGDSLLFVAGMYAAKGVLNIFMLNALLIPLAILGDATSYFIGARTGPRLFNKPETRFFKPQYIKQAHDFYEKHGGKAIVLARFVPIVRTFVPVVAGVAGMRYRDFALYNVFGAAFWVVSMTIAGFFLGQIEVVEKNLEKVVILIVVLSVIPAALEWWKARRTPASAE